MFLRELQGMAKSVALKKVAGKIVFLKRQKNTLSSELQEVQRFEKKLRKTKKRKTEFNLSLTLEGGFE